jgi:hypothetical protein
MGLIHRIYTSVAVTAIGAAELDAILETSRVNNRAADVSGMLLYSDRSFFQVLEGAEEAVDAVYARIAADPRHRDLRTLVMEPITKRGFADWAMGHAEASEAEFAALAGVHDIQSASTFLATLADAQARTLMAAFVKGRWRSRLSDSVARPARLMRAP